MPEPMTLTNSYFTEELQDLKLQIQAISYKKQLITAQLQDVQLHSSLGIKPAFLTIEMEQPPFSNTTWHMTHRAMLNRLGNTITDSYCCMLQSLIEYQNNLLFPGIQGPLLTAFLKQIKAKDLGEYLLTKKNRQDLHSQAIDLAQYHWRIWEEIGKDKAIAMQNQIGLPNNNPPPPPASPVIQTQPNSPSIIENTLLDDIQALEL